MNEEFDKVKTCSVCGLTKHLSEFYKDGTNSKGQTRYRSDCKACYKQTRAYESDLKERKATRELGRQALA